jgi:predicted NUDIX family NTP pyrophosphohydrolase
VFLGHPGTPFSRNRDIATWTIPKGSPNSGETLEDCARREFFEEVGVQPFGDLYSLGTIRQSAKHVAAWAWRSPTDLHLVSSKPATTEFPARSGRWIDHPELDRCAWFTLEEARTLIVSAQVTLLDRLEQAAITTS